MPRNGEDLEVGSLNLDPELANNPDYQATVKMIMKLRDTWEASGKELEAIEAEAGKPFDFVKFSRLSVVAFTQLAAVLAVDVHMTPEQFLQVTAAQFAEAYKRAPRFG